MRADRWKKLVIAISAAGMIALIYFASSALRANSASRYSQSNPPFGYPGETRPAYCAPIPRRTDLPYTPSPTPNLQTQQSPKFRAEWTPGPSVTPLPLARIIDLDPDVPREKKVEVTVFRCDGSFERWLLGPDHYREQIQLEPGDIIFDSAPPAYLMGHEPPRPTPKSTSTPLPYPPPPTYTSRPYPAQ